MQYQSSSTVSWLNRVQVQKQASKGVYGNNMITQHSDLGVNRDPNKWSP